MEDVDVLLLILEVMVAVFVSSVLSPFIPKVSTPLVQIALGVAWYFTPFLPNINLDTSLFMMLFIAPLLYLEARNIERSQLAKVLGLALSLAIGLVLVTMTATGFALHALWPLVSLPAAFALGATLGPTDAVAVAQIGKEAQLTNRQHGVLNGESLFNDAASIVGFQFAVLAATTGEFSPFGFTEHVVASFVGGILIGSVVGWVFDRIVLFFRREGMETMTRRILLELFLPFAAYVAAEECHVSGVLAVVAAGLVTTFHRRGLGGDVARANLVSNSVWQFFDFTLNGSVFVLLGIELPIAMQESLASPEVSNWMLIAAIAMLTVISLALRFLWISGMLRLARDEKTGKRRKMTPERWHSALVMTFGGPKGTISLALAFTLPYSIDFGTTVPIRSSLLFIASGFIVVSLTLANVMLPLLAPRAKDEHGTVYAEKNVEMLRRTIERIGELDSADNHGAVRVVLHSYNERIERLKRATPTSQIEQRDRLRLATLEHERDWLAERMQFGSGDEKAVRMLYERIETALAHLEGSMPEGKDGGPDVEGAHPRFRLIRLRHRVMPLLRRSMAAIARRTPGLDPSKLDAIHRVQADQYADAIDFLNEELRRDTYDAELVSELLVEYRSMLAMLRAQSDQFINRSIQTNRVLDQVRTQAFQLEMASITDMLDEHEITREQARMMRKNVYLMQADVAL